MQISPLGFKNQKLALCLLSGLTSASTPRFSFALHLLSQGALLPHAILPQMQKQGSLHVLTSLVLWAVADIVYWRTHLKTTMQSAHSGKLLLLLSTNHVQINHDFLTSPTCLINAKLLNLWSFEQHCSHAKHN